MFLSIGKDPDAGKEGSQAEKRMRWLDAITDSMDRSLSKSWRWWRAVNPACCSPQSCQESERTERLDEDSLQYSCLGNPTDTGAWGATFPGELKEIWLSSAAILYFSLIVMLIQVTSITENNLLKWRVFVVSLLPWSYKTERTVIRLPNTRERTSAAAPVPKLKF